MQAISVIIPGDYWDVQIYRGRLHLWTMSGDLTTVQWDDLVDRLALSAESSFAVRIGLSHGAALYSEHTKPMRDDPEFRHWILQRFDCQAKQTLVVDQADMVCPMLRKQDNPLPELPVDTEIYDRMLYAATNGGVWKASVGSRTVRPVSTRPIKLSDVPAVSVRAYSRQLALAATSEGLFKLSTDNGFYSSNDLKQLSTRHCEGADWAFQSIFASSTLGGGFLYSRYWRPSDPSPRFIEDDDYEEERADRVLHGGVFNDCEIDGALENADVSWARAEKIYTAQGHRLTSSKLTQNKLQSGIKAASTRLGEVTLESANERPTSGGSSTFGTIVEFDDKLIVVASDETQATINGPVTRWRTYPRSINYENHLHVIFDDHLRVFAFYKDYFVDQQEKRFGFEYRPSEPGRQGRGRRFRSTLRGF